MSNDITPAGYQPQFPAAAPSYGPSYGTSYGQPARPAYPQPYLQATQGPAGDPFQHPQQPPYQGQPGQPSYSQPQQPVYSQSYPHPAYGTMPAGAPAGQRPGAATAASVIGYILSAFLFLAGLFVMMGASTLDSLAGSIGLDAGTGIVYLLGIGNIVAGGLLIAGGVGLAGGRSSGRVMLSAATAIILVCGLRWMAADGISFVWPLGFCAPAILATVFAWQSPVTRWLATRR